MTRAFSIARARDRDFPSFVRVGNLDGIVTDMEFDHKWIDDYHVDGTTLTFNTGFVDETGKELFTGDFVKYNDRTCEVGWSDEGGHFFIRYFGPVNASRNYRRTLTARLAKHTRIIGNIYEEIQED